MRRVALRQRRGALGGQHVNAARLIHTRGVRVIPGPFPQRDHARHHAWGHLRFDMHFPTVVEDANAIAVGNAALAGIDRVNPHLLPTGGLQYINVAVGRVDARFIVETGQL